MRDAAPPPRELKWTARLHRLRTYLPSPGRFLGSAGPLVSPRCGWSISSRRGANRVGRHPQEAGKTMGCFATSEGTSWDLLDGVANFYELLTRIQATFDLRQEGF
jgi:hypothetical protein